MRLPAWPALLALAACAPPAAPVAVAPAASPAVCRIGPDGGRPVADRGIGGTGAPAVQTADRGIGGTGIIGVITGFASVCVAGEEVALPSGLPARIDATAGTLDDLRAGQVVALRATGPGGELSAREIVVRHVVIGPVQASGDDTLVVAGQQVRVAGAAGRAVHAAPGQFVAISGFRQPGGTIVATRVDPATAGSVLLRGELTRIFGEARIGAQTLRLPESSALPSGFPVVVTGTMRGDVLVIDTAARDLADESPAAYFGPTVSNFVVEGFLAPAIGGFFVYHDFIRSDSFSNGADGRGIATFSRRPGGGLAAQNPGAASQLGGGSNRAFTPAPLSSGVRAAFGGDRQTGAARPQSSGFNGPDNGGFMPPPMGSQGPQGGRR